MEYFEHPRRKSSNMDTFRLLSTCGPTICSVSSALGISASKARGRKVWSAEKSEKGRTVGRPF